MRSERGQASVEWVAAVLCVSLALGAAGAGLVRVDGRPLGGALAHAIACGVRGGCDRERDALASAYGERDAELVRRFAPSIVYERGTLTLPVDFRRCRSHGCSDAPDDPDLDAHVSARGGMPATAFTHVVHRDGETFVQYWLYYPDSTTTAANAAGVWSRSVGAILGKPWTGHHADDWEGFQVRVGPDGRALSRATSHHGYQWCKQRRCKDRWGPWTGWTRVSRGSHAGHVPTVAERTAPWSPVGRGARYRRTPPRRPRDRPAYPGVDMRERTTTADGLVLVPIESVDTSAYRPLDPGIVPPWRKEVYEDPTSDSTS
ncbi:MAG TPA: hypothetical protein VF520_14110 [Thermoleophilaceae bacterium]|jgi:hypothetical protein